MKSAAKKHNAITFSVPDSEVSFLSAFILPHLIFTIFPIATFIYLDANPDVVLGFITIFFFLIVPFLIVSWVYSVAILIIVIMYCVARLRVGRINAEDIVLGIIYTATSIGYLATTCLPIVMKNLDIY